MPLQPLLKLKLKKNAYATNHYRTMPEHHNICYYNLGGDM